MTAILYCSNTTAKVGSSSGLRVSVDGRRRCAKHPSQQQQVPAKQEHHTPRRTYLRRFYSAKTLEMVGSGSIMKSSILICVLQSPDSDRDGPDIRVILTMNQKSHRHFWGGIGHNYSGLPVCRQKIYHHHDGSMHLAIAVICFENCFRECAYPQREE